MIIDCNNCLSKVDCKILAENEFTEEDSGYKYSFLKCIICNYCLVACSEWSHYIDEYGRDTYSWDSPVRVWPSPAKARNIYIPYEIWLEAIEADKCKDADAYSAALIMYRKTIEQVCVHFECKKSNLKLSLQELYEKKIIDDRLYDWSELLRKYGNLAAHELSINNRIKLKDVENIQEFTFTLLDYVFVLSSKYDEFVKRNNTHL